MRTIPLLLILAGAVPTYAGAQADPVAHYFLRDSAEAAFASGAFQDAANAFRRLAAEAPTDGGLWARLASAEARLERWPAALEALERAQDLSHAFGAGGSLSAALIHAGAGNDSAAIAWVRRALAEQYGNRPRLRTDERFARLRAQPEFQRLAGIPPEGISRDEGWRFDLRYFLEEAQRLHAHPERPAFGDPFTGAVARLIRQVPARSDQELLAGVTRAAALLDDGHSAIYGPGEDSPLALRGGNLPVKFYLFADGLHVVEADEAHRDLVGARVERLGGLTPEAALDSLRAFRGVDNPMTLRWLGVQFYLRSTGLLGAIGAVDTDTVPLHVVFPDGTRRTVGVGPSDWPMRRKLRPPAAPDTARWLRHVEVNYWLETLPGQAVYVQFNQVRDRDDGPDIAAFAQVLGDSLRVTGARDLIVDLRHNNGGNNGLVRPLVRVLIAWELTDPDHTIWVLTGRNTFSAAQNFLNRVERWTDAVIVGEPSASSPNFVGEETDLILPWSRLRGSISNRYWQDSDPTDRRPWIHPDVPVTLSSGEYFGGRDPVMDAVLAIIARRDGS